jgi:hypothetical protein
MHHSANNKTADEMAEGQDISGARILSSVDVNSLRRFTDAPDDASCDITDANIADLSSVVAEFGFVRLLREIEVHDPKFPVARYARWDRKVVQTSTANPHAVIRLG